MRERPPAPVWRLLAALTLLAVIASPGTDVFAPDTAAAQNPPPRPGDPNDPNRPPRPGDPDDPNRPPRPGDPNDPNRPPRPGDPDDPNRPPRPGDPPRQSGRDVGESELDTAGSVVISGDVWVDNWFRLYVNGRELIEDSVSIRTERSFNAERFTFRADPPFTFAFEFRDFMENETGLEYIGTGRQQMGDGGAIAQFRNAQTGAPIAVTDGNWRCLTVQHAPVDTACARERNPTVDSGACAQRVTEFPDNWTAPDFDDSAWPRATEHSAGDVRPKDGYNGIDWLDEAKFIWGPDLQRDNVVLCRLTVR